MSVGRTSLSLRWASLLRWLPFLWRPHLQEAVLEVDVGRDESEGWSLRDPALRFCDAENLPALGCGGVERGVSWPEFLENACRFCHVGQACELQPASDELVQMAREIVETAETDALICVAGLISAMIVSAQFFIVSPQNNPELQPFLDTNVSLAPFPFNTLQYSLYTNMVPARFTVCDGALSRGMTNIYVPRVHIEDTGRCGMVYDDSTLVRRCRTRRRTLAPPEGREAFLNGIQCPSAKGIRMEPHLAARLHKYSERASAPSQQCQHSRGMWREAMSDVHKCVLVTVAHHLGFKPGQLMLDWGSGCGHTLTWAKSLFDVDGVGLDLEGGAVAWARRHSAGAFCQADGRELGWLPDGAFDYVFSYAAIYHLTKSDQCSTGIQLISKLRVGGRAYFGWNQDFSMNHWEWRLCLVQPDTVEDLPGVYLDMARAFRVEVEAVEDAFLFPPNVDEGHKHYLYQYPAYSIFVTRLA